MRNTIHSAKLLSVVTLLMLLPLTNAGAQDERIQRIDPKAAAQDEKLQQIDRQVPSIPPPPPTEAISGWWDEWIGVPSIDFPGKVIARLPVPEGSYVIVAKMEVLSHYDANGRPGCRLIAGGDTDQAQEVWGKHVTPDWQKTFLSNFNPQTIALNVVHTYTGSNSVLLQCWGRTARDIDGAEYPFGVRNIKITAIRVAKLTNNPLKLVQ